MSVIISIALGAAAGALSRHFVAGQMLHWLGTGFPWGVLTVNIVGSFVLGVLTEISALVWTPSPEVRAFLTVGFLSSFTTFSAFSLDVVLLSEEGRWALAAVYVGVSVMFAVGAFFVGLRLTQVLLP